MEPAAAARMAMTLDSDDVEAIARRVAELVVGRSPTRLVNANDLARQLGVSPSYVYRHAHMLGAQRLGDGPKARLRFDLEQARAVLAGSAALQPPMAAARTPQLPSGTPRRKRSRSAAPPIKPRTQKRPPAVR